MTLQVAIIGIDGSGKSTLAAALATVVAAECGLVAGSAVANQFWIRAPELDLMAPGFHPQGYAISARLNTLFRGLTRILVDNRALYPAAKVTQMLLQDNAAVKLSRRYGVDVMISDGNLFLSGAGRAFNYRGHGAGPPSVDDVDNAFRHLLQGAPLPSESGRHLPDLKAAGALAIAARVGRLQGIWIPDLALFLDLTPEAAMARVRARGARVDRHENPADLATAREGYVRVLEVVERSKGEASTQVLEVASLTPGEVVAAAAELLKPHLPHESEKGMRGGALHEAISRQSLARRVLSYRYVWRYLLRRFFEGAWREPLFLFSRPGRVFLKDGYSAGVMRLIYDQRSNAPLLDRVFYGYPLHRAVRDRLAILERRLESELRARMAGGGSLCIFTAPSGFAYDVMRPLQRLKEEMPEAVARVTLVAADLDPAGDLKPELEAAARAIGCTFTFLRGDLTAASFRTECGRFGPFRMALFVGLSSWLPKPPFLDHLRWLATQVSPDGVLVTDVFTPAGYAVGGAAMGYRANYYPPELMRTLLDYCGFDGLTATVESGRDRINHVVVAARRT
ncbi:MAG TPA: hypothetical protein VJT78_03260 [Candidatus Dormibacteraeota bacterium]|nr:hypothetical protein [Candidatus Dormibacteraeota bacterium]